MIIWFPIITTRLMHINTSDIFGNLVVFRDVLLSASHFGRRGYARLIGFNNDETAIPWFFNGELSDDSEG